MTLKDLVFDHHALANEAVAGNFAISTYPNSLLNFHKAANFRSGAYLATIKVHEAVNGHFRSQLHILCDDTEVTSDS